MVSLWDRRWSRPGEQRRYTLEIGALSGAAQLDQIAGQARQLAGLAPAETR